MIKNIIFAVMLVFASLTARAEFISATVGVDGLTCSMCAKGVEESLKQLDFIENVKIDLNKLIATINFKKNSTVEIDKLREMIEDAGFSVRSLETYHFIGTKEQTLSGPVNLRFVDKQFVNKREFGELAKKTKFECYTKGIASNCCKTEGRLYHVTIRT
jgi:copper chaperone CopZ